MIFADRWDAGRRLAARLGEFARRDDTLVLALPRGGVPVGYEIAREIRAPLDILVVRKLGVPGQPELALGAVASGGLRVVNQALVRALSLPESTVEAITSRERGQLERQEAEYRAECPAIDPANRIVILTDDGLATGASMRAAVQAVRARRPAQIVVAVPVAAAETRAAFSTDPEIDGLVCLECPREFEAVGQWYMKFDQVTEAEVRAMLRSLSGRR